MRRKLYDIYISTHSLTRRLTSRLTYPVEVNGISTHSLTRRLTLTMVTGKKREDISTHSLTRRLTGAMKFSLSLLAFQLTASRGG